MDLGHFSLSLAVKDIEASYAFYRSLGYEDYDNHLADKWVILTNGDMHLGLFEGMFDENIITYHPADIEPVRAHLAAQGLALPSEQDDNNAPLTYLMLSDPDGNQILIDQVDPDYRPTG